MATQDELTQGLTSAGGGLYLDPITGEFKQVQTGAAGASNQWMWGPNGLAGLGGATQGAIIDPFLGIQEQYRGGNAITADTWQEAVSKSLEGFMRANYGVDPIFNWQPGQSGLNDQGQFRLGTLQELANSGSIPGMFFDTMGPLARNLDTGDIVNPNASHTQAVGQGGAYDPLMGFAPDQKFLGFEDVPLEQLEKLVGAMPGAFLNPAYTQAYSNLGLKQLSEQWQDIQSQYNAATDNSTKASLAKQSEALGKQIHTLQDQLSASTPRTLSLQQLRDQGGLQDFNDYMFALDINPYTEADKLTVADPKAVMKQFMSLPQYQLLYGDQMDPNATPEERFKADPGYQFAQDEGMKQIQRNSAARGLLESGATQRDLQTFGQGMADQNFQRFQGQQSALFSDWQNQLSGVAQRGAAASGQSAQNAVGTGGSLAQQYTDLGSNLANLFANQGTTGGSLYSNTGAAQAGVTQNTASLLAQLQAAQMSANAAQSAGGGGGGTGGMLQGIGSMIGQFFG